MIQQSQGKSGFSSPLRWQLVTETHCLIRAEAKEEEDEEEEASTVLPDLHLSWLSPWNMRQRSVGDCPQPAQGGRINVVL